MITLYYMANLIELNDGIMEELTLMDNTNEISDIDIPQLTLKQMVQLIGLHNIK